MNNSAEKEQAVALFNKYSCLNEGAPGYSATLRDEILAFTAGLPIALAHVGTYVRRKDGRLQEVLQSLQETPECIISARSGTTRLGSLFRVVNSGLEDLDEHPENSELWLDYQDLVAVREKFQRKPFSAMYAALTVLRDERPRVPLYILAYVWGFGIRLAKKVAELFEDCGCFALEPAYYFEDAKYAMIALHDLQFLHAQSLCSNLTSLCQSEEWPADERVSLPKFHRNFISNFCIGELNVAELTPNLNWASIVIDGDGDVDDVDVYMALPSGSFSHNIERHLYAAVEGGELGNEYLAEFQSSVTQRLHSLPQPESGNEKNWLVALLEDALMAGDDQFSLLTDLTSENGLTAEDSLRDESEFSVFDAMQLPLLAD